MQLSFTGHSRRMTSVCFQFFKRDGLACTCQSPDHGEVRTTQGWGLTCRPPLFCARSTTSRTCVPFNRRGFTSPYPLSLLSPEQPPMGHNAVSMRQVFFPASAQGAPEELAVPQGKCSAVKDLSCLPQHRTCTHPPLGNGNRREKFNSKKC